MYLNDVYNFQQYILTFLYGAQLLSQIAVMLTIFCNNTLFIFICAEYTNSEILNLNHITCFFVHYTLQYTRCHRRNGPNFGRVFLTLNYTDITQNTYIQS